MTGQTMRAPREMLWMRESRDNLGGARGGEGEEGGGVVVDILMVLVMGYKSVDLEEVRRVVCELVTRISIKLSAY